MVSLEMISVCTLSLELFSTLSAGSRCVQVPLSPLLARLPGVIEAKVFEHDMPGFINLATSLTCPGSNVIQVEFLSVFFSNFDYFFKMFIQKRL